MKQIDFHNIDINSVTDKHSEKKFSPVLLFNKIKKIYRKKREENKQQLKARLSKVKTFVRSYDRFDKYIFLIYILLAFAIYFTFTFTHSAFAGMYEVQSKISAAKQNIEILKNNIETLKNSDEEIAKIKSDIEKMKKIAPDKPTEEDVIITLGNLLSGNALSSPERYSWTKEKDSAIVTAGIYENFDVYSYTFSTTGSFDDIKNFISDLRNNLRIMDIKDIKMVPLASGDIDFTAAIWTYSEKGATDQS